MEYWFELHEADGLLIWITFGPHLHLMFFPEQLLAQSSSIVVFKNICVVLVN